MAIYLSKLVLNPRDRHVRQDLANCHDLHRTILRGFGESEATNSSGARDRFGVLYRVESDVRGGAVQVLVQSNCSPNWQPLAIQCPEYFLSLPETKPIDDAVASIQARREFIFRLRANPTRRVHQNSSAEQGDIARWAGKRVELRTEPEWLEWIERKGMAGGFDLLRVAASADPVSAERFLELYERGASVSDAPFDVRANKNLKVTGTKKTAGPKPHRLTFGAVRFDGRLQVTDAERFRATLVAGIGSAKAYGFGLLSIAPVPTDD